MSLTFAGFSVLVEIWKPLAPTDLLLYFWTWAFGKPRLLITFATWPSLTFCTKPVWMRVPDLKSMPKLSPLPPIASAPISRITPESEKNQREAPMKSNVQRCPLPSAPSAERCVTSFERAIAPSAACVASTAVNRETSTPMPSVNANPFTSAVASANRMKAVMNVTTFASTIAAKPRL